MECHGALVDSEAATSARRERRGEGELPESESREVDAADDGPWRGEEEGDVTSSMAAFSSSGMPAPVTALTSK